MKSCSRELGFSLVEVTLALGITAISILAVIGLLPAGASVSRAATQSTKANLVAAQVMNFLRSDVRLPPGQANKVCGDGTQTCSWANLHGHWLAVATPDTLYFTQEGKPVNSGQDVAAFRATITYNQLSPTGNTSLASITVSWPAQGVPEIRGFRPLSAHLVLPTTNTSDLLPSSRFEGVRRPV